MSTQTEPAAPDIVSPDVTPLPRRISLAEYDAMIQDGTLDPDDRVELLDGLLVKKMTKGFRHVAVARRIQEVLRNHLPEGWYAIKEDPIDLPGGSEGGAGSRPEPDGAVLRGSREDYDVRFPTPHDIALVIEVASETRMLARDRAGLARYAWNGIPCVWIVNLKAGVIEVYTRPSGPGEEPMYEDHAVKCASDRIVVPLGEDRLELDVGQLLA